MREEIWIESLAVKDLGPFNGQHMFDFGEKSSHAATCIVGANGSGKTYLVSAIRWMFGTSIPLSAQRGDAELVNELSQMEGIETYSVDLSLDINGSSCIFTRTSEPDSVYVPPDNALMHFDKELASSHYAEEFYGCGGHGGGALIVYSLGKFLEAEEQAEKCMPLFFDSLFAFLDPQQSGEVIELLSNHQGQLIFCETPIGSRKLEASSFPLNVIRI